MTTRPSMDEIVDAADPGTYKDFARFCSLTR